MYTHIYIYTHTWHISTILITLAHRNRLHRIGPSLGAVFFLIFACKTNPDLWATAKDSGNKLCIDGGRESLALWQR